MNKLLIIYSIFIIAVLVLTGIFVLSFFNGSILPEFFASNEESSEKNSGPYKIINFSHSGFSFKELRSHIRSGGPLPDGIPPIENPKYISAQDADLFLLDDDIIFGFNDGQENILAFPQYIMVWHEIVNELINETKISFTYCPLTGSAVGFVGHYLTVETSFGTSGELLNSNLIMYDRENSYYWPQILGYSISKDNPGTKLEKIQLIWTTWNSWRTKYPTTKVLSEDTGFNRNYGYDPYGSYSSDSSYYTSSGPIFPVMIKNSTLLDKTVVVGIEHQNSSLAIQKSVIRHHNVINTKIGSEEIVIFYDKELDAARVYKSSIDSTIYEFEFKNGIFIDKQTESTWTIEGVSEIGNLEPLVYFDVMWFAWYAFFPNTSLILFD